MLATVVVAARDALLHSQRPPIIDISPLHVESEKHRRQDVIKQIAEGFENWGFIQIVNHTIDPKLLRATQEKMKEFFQLPLDVKNKVKRNEKNSRGFANDELTKQKRDWKEIFDFGGFREDDPSSPTQDGYNQWPDLEGFRPIMQEYFEANVKLSQLILDAIAEGLGIDPSFFRQAFTNHTSFARLNYYPVMPNEVDPTKQLGISRHTDAGALTMLWQDGPGLEVYSGSKEDKKDGSWVPVNPPNLDAFTINIGDMVHVWTGGRYQAPEHRVIANHDKDRYSIPFFYNPSYDVVIQPIPGIANSHQKYRPFTWGQFRLARFAGDYADLGKESQIEDWEILPSDEL